MIVPFLYSHHTDFLLPTGTAGGGDERKMGENEMETKAEKALEIFEHHPKTETRAAFYCFKGEAIVEDNPYYVALREVVHTNNVSEDSAYRFVHEALEHIASGDKPDFGEWADADTDVYTSSLTEWLNESEAHVEYLGEAAREFGADEGYKLLQMAQYLAREEIYSATWEALENITVEEEEAEPQE